MAFKNINIAPQEILVIEQYIKAEEKAESED